MMNLQPILFCSFWTYEPILQTFGYSKAHLRVIYLSFNHEARSVQMHLDVQKSYERLEKTFNSYPISIKRKDQDFPQNLKSFDISYSWIFWMGENLKVECNGGSKNPNDEFITRHRI